MATPESLLIEGRDPTIPLEGEGVDVGQYDVYGRGAQEDAGLPFLPPMRRDQAVPLSYTPSLLEAPTAAPAPTPSAVGAGEQPQELGPLVGANDEFEKSQLALYDAERAALDAQRAYQESVMGVSRDLLAQGYGRVAEAGRETEELMEQQRQRRPPVPTPPIEPAVPQQRIEPFGTGPEKETGMQALQRITMTLGLMAQMGMGLKSGYTRGAMAAFGGALDGWAKGQQIKAQQEWKEYLANVQKIDREWTRERQHYDDILRTDGVDLDRAKTKMAIRQTELGYHKSLVDLTLRDVDQRFKMLNVERDMIQNLMKNSLTAMNMRMLANEKALQRADLAKYRADTIHERELTRRMQEQRDRMNEQLRRDQMAQTMTIAGMADATRREAIEQRREAAAERAARPAGGAQAAQNTVNVGIVRRAVDSLKDLTTDPAKSKVVDEYLGPAAQAWSPAQRAAPGLLGELPNEIVDLDQHLGTLNNYMVFLLSGKATTGPEATRIMAMQPKKGSTLKVFKRELQNTEANVKLMEDHLVAKAKAGDPLAQQVARDAGLLTQSPGGGQGGARTVIVRNSKGEIGHFNLQPGQQVPAGYQVVQ